MRTLQLNSDLVVTGAGMAGTVAAIAAARLGRKVVLVQDRPVLGGNASSEIRVWITGAQAHDRNRYAREGGILNEMLMEQLYRNPHCSPPVWNAVLLDFVLAEPNITLLLDTAVDGLAMADDGRTIQSLSAYCSISQTRYTLSAPHFADCSGDSIVGMLCGAEFRLGKESRDEFGEPDAPAEPAANLLGASLYWYSRDRGKRVPFVRPDFAIDISDSPRIRNTPFKGTIQGCKLWWLEWGGRRDTVHEAGEIKQYLTGAVYGLWDHIKNSGKYPEADNLDLEWVGPMPGKRESYRLVGPHILTEHDLFDQPDFPDSCATGGWTIDHHPSDGIHSQDAPSRHVALPGPYNIPLRTMFSRNIANLWMAGRNISASNVAFGSIRVMGTGAACGQAVGTAVHFCLAHNVAARELVADERLLRNFRRQLLKDDQHIIHLRNDDPADLALQANVTASDSLPLRQAEPDIESAPRPLTEKAGKNWLMLPIASPKLEWIEFFADVAAEGELELELRTNEAGHHYFPNKLLATRLISVKPGRQQWLRLPVELDSAEPRNIWFVLKPSPQAGVSLYATRERMTGCLSSLSDDEPWPNPRTELFAFRLSQDQPVFEADNITNGYSQPYIMPRLWISGRKFTAPTGAGGNPANAPWVELSWPEPQQVSELLLYFSADFDMQIPTMLLDYPFRAIPTVIKEATVFAELEEDLQPVAEIRHNHMRLVRLKLKQTLRTRRLRLRLEAANGADRAELCEVRVYG